MLQFLQFYFSEHSEELDRRFAGHNHTTRGEPDEFGGWAPVYCEDCRLLFRWWEFEATHR